MFNDFREEPDTGSMTDDTRRDPLTQQQRSALMRSIRSKGNRSTEGLVADTLRRRGIDGWTNHCKELPGTPDFYFADYRLALFVHGCFWHVCPKCNRRTPRSRRSFWTRKLDENRRRDQRVRRKLWRNGYHVVRVWEHDLKGETWIRRLESKLEKLKSTS